MAVDDLVADQSQRSQPRTVAMLPLPPAATTVFPATGRDPPFRSVFAGRSAANAARGRCRHLSFRPRSRRTPLMRRINCWATLVSHSAIVRMNGVWLYCKGLIPSQEICMNANGQVGISLQNILARRWTEAQSFLAADPTSADFTVDFTIGSQERTDINSYPATYSGPMALGRPVLRQQYRCAPVPGGHAGDRRIRRAHAPAGVARLGPKGAQSQGSGTVRRTHQQGSEYGTRQVLPGARLKLPPARFRVRFVRPT